MKTSLLAALSLVSMIAACGGSSDPGPETPPPPVASNEVPASATASTEAYTRYAASLLPSETAEPLDVSKVVAPTSESEEPREI